jgi:nonsense-mediated mRNA decay protein 3
MFCVECGNELPIYKNGVCIDCYVKSQSFTQGPDIIDIVECSHCGSYKFKNIWTNDLFSDVIRRVVKNNFQISKELENPNIETDCKENKSGRDCKVIITGLINGKETSEEHNLTVRIKKNVCDVCSKQYGGYHEAILQIRADTRDLTNKELRDIRNNVESIVEDLKLKGNRALFITDIAKEHNGLDFYLSEKGAGLVIAKKIQDHYGGEIKQSSKNIGMKDSKQIYRMTYLIRLPSYKNDDFIRFEDSIFKIISVHGKRVQMLELTNWEETTIEIKKLKKAVRIGGNDLVKNAIIVSQTNEELQIMDDKTFKIKIIKKPKEINFTEKTIDIIKIDENIFILPNQK